MTPELSVVIVASWSAEAAGRTVASLGDGAVEIIVVSAPDRVSPPPPDGAIRWIVGRPGDGVPALRRLGAGAASGRVIAFLEDACVVGPGWVGAIRDGFRDPRTLAATGPVDDHADASVIDRAVYFFEYAAFAARQTRRLAGINFACRRDSLGLSGPIREHEVAARLRDKRWLPGAAVLHVRRYSRIIALDDVARLGREFGRGRWGDRPGLPTLLGSLAMPAIVGVHLLRLFHNLARAPRLIRPFLGSAASTFSLLIAWSRGEARGWREARRGGRRRCGRAVPPPSSAPDRARSTSGGCTQPPTSA